MNQPSKLQVSPKSKWFSNPQSNHAVHFYPFDKELLVSLVEYFSAGLTQGDTCIAIATPSHLASLNAALRAKNIDLSDAIKKGQYIMLDADDTLASFMESGLPDYKRFLKSIGRMIYLAAGSEKPIRAFGEMVALLWEKGNQTGMIKLEEYWHDLVKNHSFSLYCAYPETLFDSSNGHKEAIDKICSCHALAVGAGY